MALELRNVGVPVGRARLIEDVSLRLEAGSLTIIPGANGAGKSTALAVLAGDLRPSAGDALLYGDVIVSIPPPRACRAPRRRSSTCAFEFFSTRA
jgi:ABC-type hemin transport system ATPase subunit